MIAWALMMALCQIDGGSLSTADLSAFRQAIRPSTVPARPVEFLDLWKHPDLHRSQFVRLSGRFARQFHQPAYDGFPALTELWLSTPSGDLFCLVFPSRSVHIAPSGQTLEFEGTFLRLLRYSGGDGPRLAPLVIGPNPPRAMDVHTPEFSTPWLYWLLGLLGTAALGLILAILHMRRPPPVRLPSRAWIDPVEEVSPSDTPVGGLDEPSEPGENA